MRFPRFGWQERVAVLAILVGVLCAGTAWATEWLPSEGPGTTTGYLCYQQPDNCMGWLISCQKPKTSGIAPYWFQCQEGGTVWLALKVADSRKWGLCKEAGESDKCKGWKKYHCLLYVIYEDESCITPVGMPCRPFQVYAPACDPDNPN